MSRRCWLAADVVVDTFLIVALVVVLGIVAAELALWKAKPGVPDPVRPVGPSKVLRAAARGR